MTNDELRRAIAERLGWKEDPGWNKVGTWVAPDGTLWHHCPNWPEDIKEALTLPIDKTRAELTLFQRRFIDNDFDTWLATFFPKPKDGTYQDGLAHGETPALAICRAWLYWKDYA